MKKHLLNLSRPRLADTGEKIVFDPVQILSFVIAVLDAVDGLIGRKNNTDS